MRKLFELGMTLNEIGSRYGVTRQRVHQIVKKLGMCRNDGGSTKRNKEKKALIRQKQEEFCQRNRGCSWEQYVTLREMGRGEKSPLGAFRRQKQSAKNRDIEWKFNLWQWWTWWQESGKWKLRGRGNGYVMARYGDVGAYEPDNVYVTTQSGNIKDYHKNKKLRSLGIDKQESHGLWN